ncbi:MAG TPA: phosphatidate cytidylyltransferase [Alphaproteobacteria bacterium]|nr:phosphatidate cytidylyltransferase [Alphaproteobacteria bacterium]
MPQPARARREALGVRILSSVVLIAVVVAAIAGGRPSFSLLIALSVLTLAWEWGRLCGGPGFGATGVALAVAVLAAVVTASVGRVDAALVVAAAGTAAVGIAARLEGQRKIAWLAAGVPYIGLPGIALVWLIADPELGRQTVGWMVAAVAATDIGAYAAGRALGGARLLPRVSPNKTWAGLFGGVTCAVLAGGLTGILLGVPRLWPLAAASAVVAVVAQLGDLFESRVKRQFGVKDAGGIIPGHGGLLDRVDGHLAAAVVVAGANWIGGSSILTWS